MTGVIIGIDPGLAALGLVVCDSGRFVAGDVFQSHAFDSLPKSYVNFERARNLADWFARWRLPEAEQIVIEAMRYPRSSVAAHMLGISWGVIAASVGHAPVSQLSPYEIRRLLGLPFDAKKEAVAAKVSELHPELEDLKPRKRKLLPHFYDAAAAVTAWSLLADGKGIVSPITTIGGSHEQQAGKD